MTRFCYLHTSILVLTLLATGACRSRQQATSTSDSTQTAAQPTTPANKPIVLTERLTALGLTSTSHWRGVNLGDALTTVATVEQEKPFEQDARHVGYTVEFPNLESADFLYYQQGGRVSTIEVDLYLNTQPSVAAYTKDLTDYFGQRYGQATHKAETDVWTGPKQEQISLKNVSKGKDYGLKVKITPTGVDGLSASAK